MKNISGKQFENELKRTFKQYHDLWFYRLQDYKDFVKINPKLQAKHAPADFILCYRGRLILIEAKSSIYPRFIFTWLRNHQYEALKQVSDLGGFSYLFFSWRKGRFSETVAVPFKSYQLLKETKLKEDKKSCNFNELKEAGLQLEKVKRNNQIIWNLTPILKLIGNIVG